MALDPELLRCAEKDPEKPVYVVVALMQPELPARPRTRQQLIDDRRAAFQKESASIRDLILRVGGAVTDEAWLSSSLRVTLPAGALPTIEAAAGVRGVDVPPQLMREAGGPTSELNGGSATRS